MGRHRSQRAGRIHSPTVRSDLIIDVGMHDGTDTAYYLEKGFDVVAIEANPALVAACREGFAAEIDDGRLTLIGAAIAQARGTASMAIADEKTDWSSFDAEFINRNQGESYHHVDVATIPFRDVLEEHGVPYYMKVDIEGLDMLPVRALHGVDDRPRYLSIESNVTSNHAPFERVFDELAELWSLGYRGFKYVNQLLLYRMRLPERPLEGKHVDARFTGESSGPFGRELPGRWLTIGQALVKAERLRLQHNIGGYGGRWERTPGGLAYTRARKILLRQSQPWYDLHARLAE